MNYFLIENKVKSVISIKYYEAVRQIHAIIAAIFEHIIY